jgi:hypothetical protein
MRKTYVKPSYFDYIFPTGEKAKRHLETWSKEQLVDQLLMSSKDVLIKKWAKEYDEEKKRG